MTEMYKDFKDKRGREWEWFVDGTFYDCICVRVKGEKEFNSPLSFHFNSDEDAIQFVNLLKKSS